MSLEEVRKVMDILSRLAFSNRATSSGLSDDLHMVVRKQISSGKNKLKRMGVVGAVAIVKNLSPATLSNDNSLMNKSGASGSAASPKMSQSTRYLTSPAHRTGAISFTVLHQLSVKEGRLRNHGPIIKWHPKHPKINRTGIWMADVCCCKPNNTQVCDHYLFRQVSTCTGCNQLPILFGQVSACTGHNQLPIDIPLHQCAVWKTYTLACLCAPS